MLDSVRFEWSTSLANALTHFINAISRKPHRPETEATNRGLDEKRSRSQTLDSMTAGMESRSFGEMSRSRSLGHGQSLERPKKSYMDSISRVNVQCSSVNVFISNDRKGKNCTSLEIMFNFSPNTFVSIGRAKNCHQS